MAAASAEATAKSASEAGTAITTTRNRTLTNDFIQLVALIRANIYFIFVILEFTK